MIGIIGASVSTSLINNLMVLPVSSGVIEPEPTTKLPFERRKVIAPLNPVASFPDGKGLVDKNVNGIKAQASSFMPPPGSREFAHLHEDGSFHLVMAVEDEREVIDKGWGLHHPWKDRGVNEILVYAPRNDREIELLKPVIEASYQFAMRDHAID